MTADLRPTTLPTFAEVRALTAFERWRLGEGLKTDLSVHDPEVWTCHACALIALVEGRRA